MRNFPEFVFQDNVKYKMGQCEITLLSIRARALKFSIVLVFTEISPTFGILYLKVANSTKTFKMDRIFLTICRAITCTILPTSGKYANIFENS